MDSRLGMQATLQQQQRHEDDSCHQSVGNSRIKNEVDVTEVEHTAIEDAEHSTLDLTMIGQLHTVR